MREERLSNLLKAVVLFFTVLVCVTPFVYIVIISLNKNSDFFVFQTAFSISLKNYYDIFSIESIHFIDFLRNSFIVSLTSAILSTFIAAYAAYAISRLDFFGKSLIMLFVLAISMFPQISVVSYLFKLMSRLGWINTYSALICPYTAWSLPLSLWILVGCFSKIPKNLDKAGLIDGCSRLQIFNKIIFPVARPGLVSTFLLSFIFAYNEFMFALILTTDHSARTVPVGIALFEGLHGEIPWGTIMAASFVTILPVVALTIIFQRHIIDGLTKGAVKG